MLKKSRVYVEKLEVYVEKFRSSLETLLRVGSVDAVGGILRADESGRALNPSAT